MVALIVLLAGTSIISPLADRLWLPGILAWGLVDVLELVDEELEEPEELEVDEQEEQVLESLSESVCLSVCGGMLPVSESV